MSEPVTFEPGDRFSTIKMDDGEANVLSTETLEALNEALDQAEEEKNPVLLAGREGMFSGGFDLAVFREGQEPLYRMLVSGAETAIRLLSFPHPVVVACTGHAVAMGMFTLMAGDHRVGAMGDYKLQANEVEIGLTPPRFAVELCRQRMTPAHFSRATVLAEPFSPHEAVEAGILDEAAQPEEVVELAREKASSLKRLNMGSHKAAKNRVRQEPLDRVRNALEADKEEWKAMIS